MVLPMNEGARLANEQMHMRRLESANDAINDKLDKIIELLEMLLRQNEELFGSFDNNADAGGEGEGEDGFKSRNPKMPPCQHDE